MYWIIIQYIYPKSILKLSVNCLSYAATLRVAYLDSEDDVSNKYLSNFYVFIDLSGS